MTETQEAGQSRAFWKGINRIRQPDASGETVIQSMWSLRHQSALHGNCITFQPLKKLSLWRRGSACRRRFRTETRGYEFVELYCQAGRCYIQRQGYYSAVLSTASQHDARRMGLLDEGKAAVRCQGARRHRPRETGPSVTAGPMTTALRRCLLNAVRTRTDYMVRQVNEFIAA